MNASQHYQKAERLLAEGQTVVQKIRDADNAPRRDALGEQAMGIWAQAQAHATLALVEAVRRPVISDDEKMLCAHGAVICGLCGYGVPVGDGGRA